MARQSKRTKRKDDIFFTVYGSSGSLLTAAEAAGYSKSAVYRYLANDSDFVERMNLAKVDTFDLIRGTAVDLAINGDVTYKVLNLIDEKTGKKKTQVVTERKRSAAMIHFLAERMGASEFDKEVRREEREKREEYDNSDAGIESRLHQFLEFLIEEDRDYRSEDTEVLEEKILKMQQELEKREFEAEENLRCELAVKANSEKYN